MSRTASRLPVSSLVTGVSFFVFLAVVAFATGCNRPSSPDAGASAPSATPTPSKEADTITLLNVSYDPTRELYVALNQTFAAAYKAKTGKTVNVQMSHGGSGKQARAVLDGLEADVVTLALAYDIDVLSSKGKLLPADWQSRLPLHSTPYASTITFLVRKGNPKNIHDWPDLIREGVQVITANPKTSGGARWNYLAAWGAQVKNGATDAQAQAYVKALYQHVPVLDSGSRGATTTFAERGIGDVLINWENESALVIRELGADKFEEVVPSKSILAEPPVALVDTYVDKHGTRAVAQAYLEFLYSPEAQAIIAANHYRPRVDRSGDGGEFDPGEGHRVALFTIDEVFGGWSKAQPTHFDDKGIFDGIYEAKAP